MGGHVERMAEVRNTCKILVGIPERRDHSEDRGRWEYNIRMDLRKID
jgi:hypothetical protein